MLPHMHQWFVYILANQKNGTLYVGITNNLARRGDEHRAKIGINFTAKYDVKTLVYYEAYDSPKDAIQREKNIKAWKRLWKLNRINEANPEWKDLATDLLQ